MQLVWQTLRGYSLVKPLLMDTVHCDEGHIIINDTDFNRLDYIMIRPKCSADF